MIGGVSMLGLGGLKLEKAGRKMLFCSENVYVFHSENMCEINIIKFELLKKYIEN